MGDEKYSTSNSLWQKKKKKQQQEQKTKTKHFPTECKNKIKISIVVFLNYLESLTSLRALVILLRLRVDQGRAVTDSP